MAEGGDGQEGNEEDSNETDDSESPYFVQDIISDQEEMVEDEDGNLSDSEVVSEHGNLEMVSEHDNSDMDQSPIFTSTPFPTSTPMRLSENFNQLGLDGSFVTTSTTPTRSTSRDDDGGSVQVTKRPRQHGTYVPSPSSCAPSTSGSSKMSAPTFSLRISDESSMGKSTPTPVNPRTRQRLRFDSSSNNTPGQVATTRANSAFVNDSIQRFPWLLRFFNPGTLIHFHAISSMDSHGFRLITETLCWFNQCLVCCIWTMKSKQVVISPPANANVDQYSFEDFFKMYYNSMEKTIMNPLPAINKLIDEKMVTGKTRSAARAIRKDILTTHQPIELLLEMLKGASVLEPLMPKTSEFQSRGACGQCGRQAETITKYFGSSPFWSLPTPTGGESVGGMTAQVLTRVEVDSCTTENCDGEVVVTYKTKVQEMPKGFAVVMNRTRQTDFRDRSGAKTVTTSVSLQSMYRVYWQV